jgi:hydrogenase nickel incorporation protein HypA/HybF
MHEVSIAVAICDEVTRRAASAKANRILNVRIRAGELTAIVNDALAFAWEVVTEGTIAGGSHLKIERIPVRIECARCGVQPPVALDRLECRKCGSPAAEIVRGRELEVIDMEVEHDAADTGRSAVHT